MVCHSSSVPSPVAATVFRMGGRHAVAREFEHDFEVSAGLVGALAIGLVDHEDVGDLQQAGLVGLHRVSPTGVHDNNSGVGGTGDLDLDLSDTDRFEQDPWKSGSVEYAHRGRSSQRQSAEMTSRSHGADEHVWVKKMFGHAHPVTENGTSRVRRRRVDG